MLARNLSRINLIAEKALSLGTEDARVEKMRTAKSAKCGVLARQYIQKARGFLVIVSLQIPFGSFGGRLILHKSPRLPDEGKAIGVNAMAEIKEIR